MRVPAPLLAAVVVSALAVAAVARPVAAAPRAVTLDDVRAAAADAPARIAAHRRTLAAGADADAAGGWPATSVQVGTARSTNRLIAIAGVPLPVLGRGRAARGVARAEADVARAEETVGAVDLRLAVTLAWLALYRAEQAATLAADGAERMRALVDVAAARRDAGDASEADVVNATAQAARARLAADDATRAVAIAGADLAGLLGWDADEALATAGGLPGGDVDAADAGEVPELRAQRRRVAAAAAAVDQARVEGRPELRLEVEVDAFEATGAPTDVLVSLAVDLPLFGRGARRVAAARARVAAEEATATALARQVSAEVTAARRRWDAATRRVRGLTDELVPAQERAAALTREAYREGEADLVTVIQTERDLLEVRGEQVDAEVDAAEAWADLERVAGGAP